MRLSGEHSGLVAPGYRVHRGSDRGVVEASLTCRGRCPAETVSRSIGPYWAGIGADGHAGYWYLRAGCRCIGDASLGVFGDQTHPTCLVDFCMGDSAFVGRAA